MSKSLMVPRACGRSLLLLCLAVSPVARPDAASAMAYVLMSDGDLADRAAVIARVRVDAIENAADLPALDYRVVVERVLKGAPATTILVRVPGNPRPAKGPALHLWGAPELHPGEHALLFLNPNGDGTYRLLHLGLGVFEEVPGGSRSFAVRSLDDSHESRPARSRATDAERSGVRDMARFERWLADRSAGISHPADYFVEAAAATSARAQAAARREVFWGKIRWFTFDPESVRTRVSWFSDPFGQPAVPGAGRPEFRAALRAWSRHRGTDIKYRYSGSTDARGGLDFFDGVNAILFQTSIGDPYDCEAGGTLALGGPWFDDSANLSFRGRRYFPILGADIVVNEGIECFFEASADPRRAAEELFGHELGHTLGLGHSCGDDESGRCTTIAEYEALMRSGIHDDGRGAYLAPHDREAICKLYPREELTVQECAALPR